ncbi:30S ribosomal protein S6e [Candidatus Woesearchaeota archaeon]|jgi:small subunit ribosomal protein S6e|nr:30S ribosomal protein S6e [Candidatus Woesearchaeota archaeon]MBT4368204.1 30S ribosomal protein S6e [Candidatus Woesearchaeota archaeon]MBT4712693.1 30S ribosomal protein S6e [Candidatus Woesearchaeota archaeon]MBT6639605.1 30S ribosomal protein S6e [Candidatus Woesearchaeota archaeon]MBT7133777.1 30S ribosomal protein S6e [Candidatus Woesearchaeota archaeon]
MKLVISDKKGKAKQIEFEDEKALRGLKIGDKLEGSSIGLEGYEFEIRGGSDSAGFPMRRDVQGEERKRILVTNSLGAHIKRKGMRKRKTVRGNTVSIATAQLNLYVIKAGKEDIFAEAKAEGEAKEGDAPKEEAKEAPAKEATEPKSSEPKEKAEEPKAEEKKEEAK